MTENASGTFPFEAPAEVVFSTLTDPDRITRWLPRGMVAESAFSELVVIRAGARSAEFRVSTVAEELRLDWSAVRDPQLGGSVRVRDADAGGSTVEVHVRVPADGQAADRARTLLAEAADHLRRDVEDNFTAG